MPEKQKKLEAVSVEEVAELEVVANAKGRKEVNL